VALYPRGKDTDTHCTGGWVGFRAGLELFKEWMKKDYVKNFKFVSGGRRQSGRPETRWKEGVLRAMEECGLRDGD
jgi:hypothetical protein